MLTATEHRTTTATTLYARLFENAHGWLEGTVDTLTAEQASRLPPGRALPAGAHYAHILMTEDFLIGGALAGGAPLALSTWQDRTGISSPPPPGNWNDWARAMTIDLPTARQYAKAVYSATGAFLASVSDNDLDREVDLTAFGLGVRTASYLLDNLILNAAAHCGEISCLKGLQDATGYPF